MPRHTRLCPPGIPQHVIQRGNNRQACFGGPEDYAAYAHWLREHAGQLGVEIHAWVFMTNHVHLLLTPRQEAGVSALMQTLGRRYVRYFNTVYQRSGTLWEGRFKSCLVQSSDYLLKCHRYIELNPVRASMVNEPADYPWSSYRSNALGVDSSLLTPHPEYLSLGAEPAVRLKRYRALFGHALDAECIEAIRDNTQQGLVFGGERFRDELETLLGRRMRKGLAGRPRREASPEQACALDDQKEMLL
jgi:putative transposase